MSCCDYDEFYRNEGIMTPVHECPRVAPLQHDDLDRPLTSLEQELLDSLVSRLGRGTNVIDMTRRLR